MCIYTHKGVTITFCLWECSRIKISYWGPAGSHFRNGWVTFRLRLRKTGHPAIFLNPALAPDPVFHFFKPDSGSGFPMCWFPHLPCWYRLRFQNPAFDCYPAPAVCNKKSVTGSGRIWKMWIQHSTKNNCSCRGGSQIESWHNCFRSAEKIWSQFILKKILIGHCITTIGEREI